ncbi:MAG: A/G-specific adenine glycosylase [Terrimicrobiaceae bacterium]
MSKLSDSARFRKALAGWFAKNGRDLPWRRTTDPYAVAVAEFMLQQTTVAAVIPYFHRWMQRFPDVQELAAASEDDVMQLWQGLGYYSRGRNLLRAAKAVVQIHGGVFPAELEKLRLLPGFGPYTAGAVAAFAYDQPVEVIDANIARVLARLANLRQAVDSSGGRKELSAAFSRWSPRGRSGGRQFVSALMDLGATICRPGEPDCHLCPLRAFCRATAPSTLPVKKPRAAIKEIHERRGLVIRRGRLGLLPSPGPWWRSLWILPPAGAGESIHTEIFTVTRHRVSMEVVPSKFPADGLKFFALGNLPPMPSPHTRAVAAALAKLHNGCDS